MNTGVLYIGGSGRSGSTFLSLLLSQNQDAFNIGQIRDLPAAFAKNHQCSCGQPVRNCAFWSKVFAHHAVVASFPQMNNKRKAFRAATREAKNWSDPAWRQQLALDHAQYLAELKELYEATSHAAGDRMLIDSSKSSEMALALSLIPDFNLYILNLVRDPRAVTVSWAKRQPEDDKLRSLTREWRTRQQQYSELRKVSPDRFKLLRYEDLTATPRETIAAVLEWANLDSRTDNFSADDAAAVSWERQHLFPPANEEVLKAKAPHITIRAAESWKAESHEALRGLAEDISFPAAERYGYLRLKS